MVRSGSPSRAPCLTTAAVGGQAADDQQEHGGSSRRGRYRQQVRSGESEVDRDHAGRQLYQLTPSGRDLWPAVHALMSWGSRHRAANSRVFKHVACGTVLDDDGSCHRCGVTPAPEDISTERRRARRAQRTDPVTRALRAPHRLLEPLETS